MLQIHLAAPAIALVAVLQWLLRLAIRPRLSQLKHLPSPKQGFFLFRLLHEPDAHELEHWIDTVPHAGLLRYLGQYNEERILVVSPAAAKDLLATETYKFVKPHSQRKMIANAAGAHGLLLLEGQQHKATRKALSPAFRHEDIKRAYPIMWDTAYELVEAIRGVSKQDQSNSSQSSSAMLLRLLVAATIDTFGRWGFSASIDAVKNPQAPIPKTYISSLKTTKHGQRFLFWAFTLGPDFVMRLPLRAVKILKALGRFAGNTAETIVQQHEEASEKGEPTPPDMINTMMRSDLFTHEDLVNQSVHFVAAATETTAGSLAWTIHLLSRHPEIQSRLREEVRANIPSLSPPFRSISETDFHSMKYLDAVIREILRFHSVNTILWREAIAPATIVGECIPVGTKVVFSPWATGRDPVAWGPDARMFRPERWLDNSMEKRERSSCAFLAFGGGPRRCPGDEYAKAQMRCLLARLVNHFEFSRAEDENGSDDGVEIGDMSPFTLFKIVDGCLRVRIQELKV